MDLLNLELREEVESHYFVRFFLKNEFFKSTLELDFLLDLTNFIQRRLYSPEDYIINEGKYGKEIYFIISGKVSLIHKETHTYITDLYVT